MKLAKGGWVLVTDGERRRIFENRAAAPKLDLALVAEAGSHEGADREIASDRPGRYPGYGDARSAVEETDFHRQEKTRFAEAGAQALNEAVAGGKGPAEIVVIADPRSLGALRDKLSKEAAGRVVADLALDAANEPAERIAGRVSGL